MPRPESDHGEIEGPELSGQYVRALKVLVKKEVQEQNTLPVTQSLLFLSLERTRRARQLKKKRP